MAEKPDEKYDVFIVHTEDDHDVASQINKGLQEMGMKTSAHYEDFSFGRSVFSNVIDLITNSKVVLILITSEALSSSWVSFEILMALEKANREQTMCLRLVFADVPDKEKAAFKHGTLRLIPDFTIDFNKDNWKKELVRNIKEKFPMEKLLPAGNVAHGLVFNYYIGYLQYVLPATSDAVKKCEYFHPGDKFATKFYILIPDSCKVKPPEVGPHGDFSIEKMPKSLEVSVVHGGKPRTYNPAVYKITKKATSEYFFFTGDSPFILNTMSKMKEMEFADIDVDAQVVRFHLTLMELLYHRNNEQCRNTATVVRFNGEAGSLASELWKALEAEFTQAAEGESRVTSKIGTNDANEKIASVTFSDCDAKLGHEIMDYLQKEKDVKFTNGKEGEPQFRELEGVRWNIFILSEKAVKDQIMFAKFEAAIASSIYSNKIQVIPILAKDSDMKKIPQSFRWITMLQEHLYLEKLWEYMQGDYKNMVELLPAGEVYQGLAYAYVVNYLPFNLTMKTKSDRGFRQRFTDAAEKFNARCSVVPKLFIIVAKSCSFPPPEYKFDAEDHLGEMEPVEQGFRKYGLHLYRLKMSDGQEVCYSREYATPAVALHDMAILPFAGISAEQRTVQVEKFASFCGQIMDNPIFNEKIGQVKEKCEIVYFDDIKHGLDRMTTRLEEVLKENIRQGHVV